MFKFTRAHFKQCVDHPLFQEGLRLAIEHGFQSIDKDFYRGDWTLVQPFFDEAMESGSQAWNDKAYALFKDRPLAYFSPCEDPERYIGVSDAPDEMNQRAIESIKRDVKTRQFLLDNSVDRYEPSWYNLVHRCEIVMLFIMFPLIRILFPQMRLFIWELPGHWVITNSLEWPNSAEYIEDVDQSLVFDLSGQTIGEKPMLEHSKEVQKEINQNVIDSMCRYQDFKDEEEKAVFIRIQHELMEIRDKDHKIYPRIFNEEDIAEAYFKLYSNNVTYDPAHPFDCWYGKGDDSEDNNKIKNFINRLITMREEAEGKKGRREEEDV